MLQKHLQIDCEKAVKWFNNKQTAANSDKIKSIVSTRQYIDIFDISVDGYTISWDKTMKMLGVTLDDKLNVKAHFRNICETAFCQIIALKWMSKFMNEQCRMNVYKSCINANFDTVLWFGCFVARLTWTNSKNCRKEHLELYMVTTRNIMMICYKDVVTYAYLMRLAAIEMFKCSRGIDPVHFNDTFIKKESNYNHCNQSWLLQPKFNTKRYDYMSFQYFGSKIWKYLQISIKNLEDLGKG